MPELPEVEVIARGLAERMVGLVFSRVELLRPDLLWRPVEDFERQLLGCRVASVARRGKYLLVRLTAPRSSPGREGSGGLTLLVHLGMTGRLWIARCEQAVAPHTHLRIALAERGLELRLTDPRRFGGLDLLPTRQESDHPRLRRVAPDPFEIEAARFAERVASHRSPIKAVLLNQGVVGGVGNIYADEALWAARIHPTARADRLARRRLCVLHGELLAVLSRAIDFGGSSISDFVDHLGERGFFQNEHRVYGKAGQPCPRCGQGLSSGLVAQRGTVWCARCQRSPR